MILRSKYMITPTFITLSHKDWVQIYEALPVESRLCLTDDGEDRESLILYDHIHRPVVLYHGVDN